GSDVFNLCTGLKTAQIPDSLAETGRWVFEGCCCTVIYRNHRFSVEEVHDGLFKVINSISSGIPLNVSLVNTVQMRRVKLFFLMQLCRQGDEECISYVKENLSELLRVSVDENSTEELEEFKENHFFEELGTDGLNNLIIYAIENQSVIYSVMCWLLSLKDETSGFTLFEIDDFIEASEGRSVASAHILEYRNRHFTTEQIEEYEKDKSEKELGIKERTEADWRRIFDFTLKYGEVIIDGYKGRKTEMIIPDMICGKPVTAIADDAFYCEENTNNQETVLKAESVVFGAHVRKIGKNAFKNCGNLISVKTSDELISIGNSAFEECTQLKEFNIPKSVCHIGARAFYNCRNLETEIPAAIRNISEDTFYGVKTTIKK
ncbi:MAG: leucine-rich repeat domain-containing protein, partial [Oscillospiraceae bacterium]|nr:leucine-rich repeat domain-containing protein [Oscillospiraceae bacterium]